MMPFHNVLSYGSSVRNFFFDDLQAIAYEGYCLMLEWICQSMVESIYAANWQPHFYQVLPPEQASMILQADIQAMMEMLNNLPQPCAVLLAHPLGYIDPSCMEFLQQIQKNPNIHVFLDLSQGYGRRDCQQEIRHVHAAYFSFNGNKLIRTGGALRLCFAGSKDIPSSVSEIFTTFYTAAEKGFNTLSDYLKFQMIEDDIQFASLYSYYQSSPYRTVLHWEKCSSSLKHYLNGKA
ncbi:hypothetical protein HZS38_09715 [Xenorhabdus nematophila]|uniref:hypothetical protein n=1 Tax=Xenorhabdus nematophila TaxID=628 RepID=UPI000541EFCE|nr:hypothetical protein [Xenorhabdus nematophila]CEF31092.1 hypothetical protein XNW1_3090005 [Xenorhabdus nematophila str. Websteri]AYA40658.1 hypothetical protein D3790_09635 [Xenorhabdus nematophila]KHD28690.1 hypothetical protein LH67_08975 [Xenorhabdus nematophila]MBA0019399.1 hypothetical protein [Xenorhabdus nematophila]MCB4426906.1 hypothetical protein [Xenorhabdus nematophila]